MKISDLPTVISNRAEILGRSISQSYIMAGPHRPLLLGATACGLFAAMAEAGILITVVPLIYTLLGDSEGPGGLFDLSKSITSSILGSQETVSIIFVLLGTMYVKQVLSSSADTLIRWAEVRIVTHVRTTVLSNLLHARFTHLDNLSTGWARQIVTGSSHEATGPVLRGAVSGVSFTVQSALVLGLMFHLSVQMTLVAIFAGLCVTPLLYRYIRLIRRYSSRYMEDSRRFVNFANETIASIRAVKLLNAHRHFLGIAQRKSHEAYKKSFIVSTLSSWQPILLLSFAFLYIAGNVFYASWTQTNFGAELAFFFVLYRLITPVTGIFSAINLLLERLPFVEQVFKFYRPHPDTLEQDGGVLLSPDSIAEIRLENVSMGYNTDQTVLKNVSLVARRGEIIAIVGDSGAGKSTLLHLLLGMYPYEDGHVLIGGKEACEINPISLRTCTAIVSQDVHLFDTTVEENLRMGAEGITDDDLEKAARLADVDRVIKQLPQGLKSMVGEGGSLLSGGQRQRVSIAQAIARNTPILVLDEITSALDGGAEHRVFEAIESIRKDRIIILITHRLTQLQDLDRIYVLDDGEIVESGSWLDLMARQGKYWQQYQQQLRAENASSEECSSGQGA